MSKLLLLDPEVTGRIVQWLFGDDTGVSSKTMAAIALGVEKKDVFGYSEPADPSDFGRCYRLLKVAPEIRDHFPRIAKRVPAFAGILENWDSLCELYERDLPKGKSAELYERMKQLRGQDCWNRGA